MTRYAGGGSDRPFWLEGYGGRPYTVERMGRAPVSVEQLAIAVVGNIQPDRLNTLFMRSDDDGLLSRIISIWPDPAPITRPAQGYNHNDLCEIFERLLSLGMATDNDGLPKPKFVRFTEEAQQAVDEFRRKVRNWESDVDGLLLSVIGKLPGLSIRLSLVFTLLRWADDTHEEPNEIDAAEYHKATEFVENYLLPMAKRAYGSTSFTMKERAGRCLLKLLLKKGWNRFSSREVRRIQSSGLASQEQIDMGIAVLERADIIRSVDTTSSRKGGRPQRLFDINPLIHIKDHSAPSDFS